MTRYHAPVMRRETWPGSTRVVGGYRPGSDETGKLAARVADHRELELMLSVNRFEHGSDSLEVGHAVLVVRSA